MRRAPWLAGFLGVTAIALAAELWASFDRNDQTDPWTDLIVRYVPGEIAAALIGALIVWLPVHFGLRYARRRRAEGVGHE